MSIWDVRWFRGYIRSGKKRKTLTGSWWKREAVISENIRTVHSQLLSGTTRRMRSFWIRCPAIIWRLTGSRRRHRRKRLWSISKMTSSSRSGVRSWRLIREGMSWTGSSANWTSVRISISLWSRRTRVQMENIIRCSWMIPCRSVRLT